MVMDYILKIANADTPVQLVINFSDLFLRLITQGLITILH